MMFDELSPDEFRYFQDMANSINPAKQPDAEFRHLKFDATKLQLETLRKLVSERASESELHEFLDTNRLIFSFALHAYQTGHHGIYVFSKQQIVPKIQGVQRGLIPDFIVGGSDSGGFHWWIVELKGCRDLMFSESVGGSLGLSSVANRAVFQLLEYMDYASEIQAVLRDSFRMTNFREPNGLIILGNEEEFSSNQRKMKLKSAWNRLHPKKLEIRTYDWLLRNFSANEGLFGFDNQ